MERNFYFNTCIIFFYAFYCRTYLQHKKKPECNIYSILFPLNANIFESNKNVLNSFSNDKVGYGNSKKKNNIPDFGNQRVNMKTI